MKLCPQCGAVFEGNACPDCNPAPQVKTFTYKKMFGQFRLESDPSKTMDEHVTEMIRDGWQLVHSGQSGGHINVGRTAAWALATGGLGLLLGASRAAEKVTLMFRKG